MTIHAVFFDLDDTLLSTSSSRGERAVLAAECLIRHHPELDKEDLVRRMLEHHPGKTWAHGADGVVRDLGLEDTDAGKETIGVWFFLGSEHLLTPVEGVLDAIAALRPEIKVGVITNGWEEIQRRKFDSLKLHDRVAVYLTSDRAGYFKPDPRIFAMAVEEAGVEAHEAVFIGDTFDSDVRGALAAGMHAVWLNPNGHSAATDVTGYHELRSFADFAALLDTLDRA